MENPNTIEIDFPTFNAEISYLGKVHKEIEGRKTPATLYFFESRIEGQLTIETAQGKRIGHAPKSTAITRTGFSKGWFRNSLAVGLISGAKRIQAGKNEDPKEDREELALELGGLYKGVVTYLDKKDRESKDEGGVQLFLGKPGAEQIDPKEAWERIRAEMLRAAEAFGKGFLFFEPDPWKGLTETKREWYPTSHVMNNALLKYEYPKDRPGGVDLTAVSRDVMREVAKAGESLQSISEVIKVSNTAGKVLDAFNRLLFNKSQTWDAEQPDYFAGNSQGKIEVLDGIKITYPGLSLTLNELAREYYGRDPSQFDREAVWKACLELHRQKELITLTKPIPDPNGGGKTQWMKLYRPLVEIAEVGTDYYDDEGTITPGTGEIRFFLHPAFREGMKGYWGKYPNEERIVETWGSERPPYSYRKLIRLILVQAWNRNSRFEREKERLLYQLEPDYMTPPKRRVAKAWSNVSRGLDGAVKLGFLKEWKIRKKQGTVGTGEVVVMTLANGEEISTQKKLARKK